MNIRELFETVYPVPRNVVWQEAGSLPAQYVVDYSGPFSFTATESILAADECNRQNARWEGFKAGIDLELLSILLEGEDEGPELNGDGSLKYFMPTVAGNCLRCDCGCNVFHKPNKKDPMLYQCNACGARWRGEQ